MLLLLSLVVVVVSLSLVCLVCLFRIDPGRSEACGRGAGFDAYLFVWFSQLLYGLLFVFVL